MPEPLVSVVLPCLNEEEAIGSCIEKIQGTFARANIAGEIVVCDNGSSDRSVPIAVVDRPGWRLRALASPAATSLARYRVAESLAGRLPVMAPPAWTLLSTRLSEASSTALRRAAER